MSSDNKVSIYTYPYAYPNTVKTTETNEYDGVAPVEELKDTPSYEMVNHPSHYKNYDVEAIDMISKIWGPFAASQWSKLNAFKYRMRVGTKPDNPIEQDLKKEKVYIEFADKYETIWRNASPSILASNLTENEKDFILHVYQEVLKERTLNK